MDNKTKPLDQLTDEELLTQISLHLKRANLACDKLDKLREIKKDKCLSMSRELCGITN